MKGVRKMNKSIMLCFLIGLNAVYAAESSQDCSIGLLDDSEVSRWNIPSPEIVLHSVQNIEGTTNVLNKLYLSAELSGVSDDRWKVQMYETVKKEMYIQGNNGIRWIAEGVLSSKLPICNKSVFVELRDNELRLDTSIHAGNKYILAQVEYMDLDLVLNGDKFLDGPYVKKKVYMARDMRSGAVALSFVRRALDKGGKIRMPTVTRFFEIQGDELRVVDDKCSTSDLIYSFANIDSTGDLVVYFGFAGYNAIVRCDKKDILRYSGILAEQSSKAKDSR